MLVVVPGPNWSFPSQRLAWVSSWLLMLIFDLKEPFLVQIFVLVDRP